MIERFLRYSLRWNCPIRLVYLEKGQMKTGNITVVALGPDSVSCLTARSRKTPRQLLLNDIMAAGYARGDDGDTSKKIPAEAEGEADVD